MANRILFTLGGLFLGTIIPIFLGGLIAALQGVTLRNFLWTLLHLNGFYNSYFQLGIAINIGIFFLIMRNPKAIYFGRGWLVATILLVLWTVLIEFHWSV
jgi:hypothetical protein